MNTENPKAKEHIQRWKSGLFLSVIGFSSLFAGGWVFAGLCSILFWISAGEFIIISSSGGANTFKRTLKTLCALAPLCAVISYKALGIWLALASCLILCLFVARSSEQKKFNLIDLACTLSALLYVAWIPSHCVLLRQLGAFYLLFPLVLSVVNDIAAYYLGKAFGKTKLAENISPNKTIKGSIGGLVAGCIVGILLFYFYPDPIIQKDFQLWEILLMSIVCTLTAQFGDLVESLMKRSVGLKDAGNLVSGHGGVLDRFDSHIIPYTLCYYFFTGFFKL